MDPKYIIAIQQLQEHRSRRSMLGVMPDICLVHRLGLVPYQQAWDLQGRLVHEIADGKRPATLLLLQHSHILPSVGAATLPTCFGTRKSWTGARCGCFGLIAAAI